LQPHTRFLEIPTPSGNTIKIAIYEWGDSVLTSPSPLEGKGWGGGYNLDTELNNTTPLPNPSSPQGGREFNKEVILCIHGLTRNGRDFDVLAEHLSANYRVIAVDMAGRGKSQWQADPALYNYPQYVADVANIIAQLGLQKIHFIGTSMGGIIGMMLANALPNLLKTLTINDIGCFVPASGLQRISQYVGASEFTTRAEAESALRLRCAAYGIASEEHWQNLFTNSIQETEDGKFRLAYDPAISKNFGAIEDVKDVDLWMLWAAVQKIPTLLIRGGISDILPADVAQKMKESHPDLTLLEIAGVGHAPALADAVQISAIHELISKHSPQQNASV